MDPILSLVNLSKEMSVAPQLTQGAGGNTSVKDGIEMYVKASGFRLDEVGHKKGFVKVSYLPVVDYLQKSIRNVTADSDLKKFVNKHIIGEKNFLPSMETGFHAVLDKFVIHTHPIAVNQLLCCVEGPQIIAQIFKNIDHVIIPFVNPGYYLSKAITDLLPTIPAVIFLQNHGLIVHASSEKEALELHQKVIDLLPPLESDFTFKLLEKSENSYELLNSQLKDINIDLLKNTFFPDQAVVIGQNFQFDSINTEATKLNLSISGKYLINASYKEALAILENLIALKSIYDFSILNKLTLLPIPIEDIAYILGMDMEKYRQELLK